MQTTYPGSDHREQDVSGFALVVLMALLLAGYVVFVVVISFFSVWIRAALFSGARVTFTELIALRLRKVPVGLIVVNRINAVKSDWMSRLTTSQRITGRRQRGNGRLALIAARK
jgi:uncharacterized membrane protein (DUF485 family)